MTLFATAAAAADRILLLPNGRGEALAVVVPEGWELVEDASGAADAPSVLVPAGADAAAERIQIERLAPAEGGTDAVIDAIEAAWRERCEAVQYGDRRTFLSSGFSGTVTTVGCTRWLTPPVAGVEQGQVELVALIPGEEMLWSLRRIWAVPAFDVLDTPISPERLTEGAEQVGRFALCKAEASSPTCPPAVTAAIARAGSATAPIILP